MAGTSQAHADTCIVPQHRTASRLRSLPNGGVTGPRRAGRAPSSWPQEASSNHKDAEQRPPGRHPRHHRCLPSRRPRFPRSQRKRKAGPLRQRVGREPSASATRHSPSPRDRPICHAGMPSRVCTRSPDRARAENGSQAQPAVEIHRRWKPCCLECGPSRGARP